MSKYVYTSCWNNEIIEYINQKKQSGFSVAVLKSNLKKFDEFCVKNNINDKIFTKEHCEKLIEDNQNIKHITKYGYILLVRLFLERMLLKGYNVHIPKKISRKFTKFIPKIYTQDEIKRYFFAVDTYEYGISGRMAIIMPILFRILYCCGTRITETLSIKKEDIDLSTGIIKLRNTKNKRERYIVLPEELRILMLKYADKVFWQLGDHSYIFKGETNQHISYMSVYKYHVEFLKLASIPYNGNGKGPRIHDFRHTSIVLTCKKLIDSGLTSSNIIPIIATWAGHAKPESTEYYLRLTSEVYPYIKDKMNDTLDNIFDNLEIPDEIY